MTSARPNRESGPFYTFWYGPDGRKNFKILNIVGMESKTKIPNIHKGIAKGDFKYFQNDMNT